MTEQAFIETMPYWLEFTSSLISSLAWPTAVITIVFILRNSIESLIAKITNLNKLTAKGIELEFSQQIQEVKIAVEDQTKSKTDIHNLDNTNLEYIVEMAKIYPTSAVIESWKWVEEALSIKLYGQVQTINTMRELYKLKKNKDISAYLYNNINKFREIRNYASHTVNSTVTTKDALTYLQIADEIITYINNIDMDNSSNSDQH